MFDRIKKHLVKKSLVKKIWKDLSTKKDTKGETLESFVQALGEKGLIKK
ncbi:MAG: hypothetical protein LBR92_04045 [Puniceicoccales bacterium]|jgi:hypothetical protein|nr:hypothetical protein [Puniceicoccales bacterium]